MRLRVRRLLLLRRSFSEAPRAVLLRAGIPLEQSRLILNLLIRGELRIVAPQNLALFSRR
jgi:hypothetical protein